jgi:hypothetical protein
MEEVKNWLVDFKDTPYYKFYEKKINDYNELIIKSILLSNDNEIKYSWNDVLKEVFKFINWELKDFKDCTDINPNNTDRKKKLYERLVEEQAKRQLGMN